MVTEESGYDDSNGENAESNKNHEKNSDAKQLAECVTRECLRQYGLLPPKARPQRNSCQWVLLAAIVMSKDPPDGNSELTEYRTVALATGSKCVGAGQLGDKGDVVSDSHAEVLARRCFRKFLLNELRRLWSANGQSEVFTRGDDGWRAVVRPDVKFHMYCSHTPCGDASIILKEQMDDMDDRPSKRARYSADDDNDGVCHTDIHRTGAKTVAGEEQDAGVSGVDYHVTGVLRTKPGRGDRSLSHCCSDKMAKWLAQGLQGGLLSHFISSPVLLYALIIGSDCPFSADVMRRALIERTRDCVSPPLIVQASQSFCDSRSSIKRQHSMSADRGGKGSKERGTPSPCSVTWIAGGGEDGGPVLQVLVNGSLLGSTKLQRKTGRARSAICRSLWASEVCRFMTECLDIASLPDMLRNLLTGPEQERTYSALKATAIEYRQRWISLRQQCFKNWTQKPSRWTEFIIDLP